MIKIVKSRITAKELEENAEKLFGNLVKAVVDIDKGIMAVYGELHSDEEAKLIEAGCRQESLWGINIYPGLKGDERIEFDSMINLRPSQKNMSRGVEDESIRKNILVIVSNLITE